MAQPGRACEYATMTTLTSADGTTIGAYEAGDGSKGIIVVQEVFGVNPHIRSVADRLAGEGYRTIAPAFFDRIEPGIELGYTQDDIMAGIGYAGQLGWENTMADVAAAAAHLRDQGCTSVGITGFCWGGTTTWLAAAEGPVDAAVGYYGGGIFSMNDQNPQVPTMLHFGELDAHIPADQVAAVEAAHPDVTVYNYPAGHGFNCDARGDYHEASAALAWERTVSFFATNL